MAGDGGLERIVHALETGIGSRELSRKFQGDPIAAEGVEKLA